MGLRDKYAKKIEEQGFRPIDLNEDNVQAIFNRCLAKEGENFYNVQVVGLELSKNPSDIVRLSGEKMEKNDQNIRYLLGQLKTIHLPDVKAITLKRVSSDMTIMCGRKTLISFFNSMHWRWAVPISVALAKQRMGILPA